MTAQATACKLRLPPAPELRHRLYRALAQELVGATGPAAIVFESSTDGRTPEVTVTPPDLVGTLLAAPAFRPLRTAFHLPPLHSHPPPSRAAVTWTLEPIDPPRTVMTTPMAWDVPEAGILLGPDGTIDFQTFWLSGRSDGRLWAGRRVRWSDRSEREVELRSPSVARFVASEWSRATSIVCRTRSVRRPGHDWEIASSRSLPRGAWLAVQPTAADRTAEPIAPERVAEGGAQDGHVVVLGASGAGKTTFLADRAARAIREGLAVFALDLHGDLTPAIVARLSPAERVKIVAVDASHRPVAGISALSGVDNRSAAQFVAAVKRLSPDGSDVYWGFRLERIFDTFVRLVQESGGTVGDLYTLLTDADRRDGARLATRSREIARFLDELGPIVRRSPEFLWPAAARLAKVVLLPELAELLSPGDGGVPVEELLDGHRSLLVRVPFSAVGPEASSFAGSLVLARTYLGLAGRRGPVGPHEPIVMILDEVQGLSPRLVAEMLTEGRKFGLRLLLASQYPERLASELRLAAAGVSREVVAFRAPRASAAGVGGWLGLSPGDAERTLSDLPVGLGVVRPPGSDGLRVVPAGGSPALAGDGAWHEAVERTLLEFPASPEASPATVDAATERLLLAILSWEERGVPLLRGHLVHEALAIPGVPLDPAVLSDRSTALEREGLAHAVDGAWHLTPAGERRLGLRAVTGASRESDEHRALLLRTFRIFARHGHALEIVRQGRYDTTLPDAIFRQIPEGHRGSPPRELAEIVTAAQRGWAWRFFGGRDVHVEAEVSGALRPARVRHGLEKARARGAVALFVVSDTGRAARVRRTLKAEGLGHELAQVWVLRGREGSVTAHP